MPTTSPTMSAAATRARARRATYLAAGWWEERPFDLVRMAAVRAPSAPAVIARDATLSHHELDAHVSRAAAQLSREGASPGDPVLIVAVNDVDSLVAIHAAWRIGAVPLLVAAVAGRSHVEQVVEQSKPVVAVAPASWLAEAQLGNAMCWIASSALRVGTERPDPAPPTDLDLPAMVLFTSGTTSKPKGVIHSRNTLLAASHNYVTGGDLSADDRVFLVSPLASITGVLQAVTVPLLLGVPVVLEDRFDPLATLDWLVATGSTWFGGPDLLLDRLLDAAGERGVERLPIRAVYLGGTMLDPRILDRVERHGIVVMRAYGSSEAPISTAGARSEPAEVRLGDDGRALDGVEVRIGSPHDTNECCLRGPHLFLGYTDPDDDANAFADDWFCTGDVATFEDGRLKIVGRIKDIVIRNGLKIPMAEVEAAATAHPAIDRAAAFMVADPTTGERLALAVLTCSGAAVDLDELVQTLVAGGLAKWKLPEELVLWDVPFPETATGKVHRQQLAAESADRPRQVAARLRTP